MQRWRLLGALLILVLGFGSAMPAQTGRRSSATTAEAAQEPGTAVGHIVCGDTQRPARLAQVRLVPVPAQDVAGDAASGARAGSYSPAREMSPVQTDMEGNLLLRKITPGNYYLDVSYLGYINPLQQFTSEQLRSPNVATRQRIARELVTVAIRPGAETRVDVTLQRGATISGTVRYDDGAPAIGVQMQLLTKGSDGKWVSSRLMLGDTATGSQGRFTLEGIPPGTYALSTSISLYETISSTMPMPNGGSGTMEFSMLKPLFDLQIYSGDVLQRRNAVSFKVEGAGEDGGHDFQIPLSKQHQLSGQVIAPDGHPVNHAHVILLDPVDKSQVEDVQVDPATRQFRFPYVPEGTFTLSVSEVREVVQVPVANAPGVVPRTHNEDKTVDSYGGAEQPLTLQNDMQGVLVTVPPVSHGTKAAVGSQP